MEFEKLDLTELDKDLSDEQRKEWNAIYASYRSASVLTSRVAGMDVEMVRVRNKDTGESETVEVNCLAIIDYRVKVLIPEKELWFDENTARPTHVLRSMAGATVDYVITAIDRENECCIASRRMALAIRRHGLLRTKPEVGRKVQASILAVGKTHLLASVGGFDITLSQRDLSYAMIPDLRQRYHAGETYTAVITAFDPEKPPSPFPSRRQSRTRSTERINGTRSAAAGHRSSRGNIRAACSAGWRKIWTVCVPIRPISTTKISRSAIR